jgi:hypothetical protein
MVLKILILQDEESNLEKFEQFYILSHLTVLVSLVEVGYRQLLHFKFRPMWKEIIVNYPNYTGPM